MLSKSAEVGKALGLICRESCMSAANLSNEQHRDERLGLEMEVQRLLLIQTTKAEAQWQDPNTKKLNPSGSEQLADVKKAMKDLARVRARVEEVGKSSPKSTPPKGEKPSPPAQLKRSASADGGPAPKKRKTGLSKPKMTYPDVEDPEDEIDAASKPIAERLRNSPGRGTPPKPPAKGKGKGKGKGRGKAQGEKPGAARSLEQYPTDDPAPTSDQDKSGDDDADSDAAPTGNREEASDSDEIEEQE